MPNGIAPSGSEGKIHLRYIRLPNRTMEFLDELVFRSEELIVGKSKVTSVNSLVFDGKKVLDQGFPITYFELAGEWYTVVKVRDLRGEHTGYYCDIVTPYRLVGNWIETTDLFLDLWVSPNLRYKTLDEEELAEALRKGWVSKRLYTKAKAELQRLVQMVENGKFPPLQVKELETKFGL
jgi:predicted RNA-binding protein associated with RNAse of E/G family